jgi:hypothetical protein
MQIDEALHYELDKVQYLRHLSLQIVCGSVYLTLFNHLTSKVLEQIFYAFDSLT